MNHLNLDESYWLPTAYGNTPTPLFTSSYSNNLPKVENMDTEIKDFSPGKWEEDEVTEEKPLSFGQKAVGYIIPERGDMDIYRISDAIAELIDIIDLRVPQSRPGTEEGFLERMTKDEATKKLIDACRTSVEYIKMVQDNKF